MSARGFDELDVAIADAVRFAPRASWRDLGSVLGVDSATVSRRWSRMRSEGVAWVTAHPAGDAMPACALVEINCAPGRSGEVADVLAEDVESAIVKLTAGVRDVLVMAQAPDLDGLSGYLLDRVAHIPGVTGVRSHVVTRPFLAGARWREGALDVEQRRRLDERAGSRSGRGGALDALDRRLVRALSTDGRMSFERLAEHVGLGPVAVRRRLARLTDAGLVAFRCDTSRHLSGRPVSAVYFGSLEVGNLREVEDRIRALKAVRASYFVAGPHNVVVDVRLRSAADIHAMERAIIRAVPALRVEDRAVVLRAVKLLGRVLDAQGRCVRSVPLLADGDGGRRSA